MKMTAPAGAKRDRATARARCVCGAVEMEIDVPAVWAWHDHSAASRHAQGCAYATYVGSWKSRFRVLKGARLISRFADEAARAVRSFCRTCGTPLFYERERAPKMVNIPRALFSSRTGREPRYHRTRRAGGLDLPGREANAAEGIPRRDVATAQDAAESPRDGMKLTYDPRPTILGVVELVHCQPAARSDTRYGVALIT